MQAAKRPPPEKFAIVVNETVNSSSQAWNKNSVYISNYYAIGDFWENNLQKPIDFSYL